MTPAKLLKILGATSAVLLLVWLGYLYTQIPHRKAPYAKSLATADTIQLQRGPARIELRKTGNTWTLGGGTSFRADVEKVKTLTDALKNMQLDDAISDRPERAADFEVRADSGLRVVLMAGGHPLADGIFGKQAPDFTHIYFKFPDAPVIYLGRGVILGELGGVDANDWRDHNLITLAETQIQGIMIETAGSKIDLERSSDTWTMNGQAIDPAPAYGLVGALAHLKADDFVNPFSTPTVTAAQLTFGTITFKSATGPGVVLRLGAEDKVTKRYPAAVDPQSLVWLAEAKVQALLPKPSVFQPKK